MWLASVGIKLKGNEIPPSKPDYMLVCETIICELEAQISLKEREQHEKEKAEKRNAARADYSWLISTPQDKTFQLTPVQRLSLEDLAVKVRPEDSGEIINQFRTILENRTSSKVEELPKIMQCVIERYLSEIRDSSDSDSTLQWIGRSVTGLGSSIKTLRSLSSSKVYPIVEQESDDSDNAAQRSKSLPEFLAMKNMPV